MSQVKKHKQNTAISIAQTNGQHSDPDRLTIDEHTRHNANTITIITHIQARINTLTQVAIAMPIARYLATCVAAVAVILACHHASCVVIIILAPVPPPHTPFSDHDRFRSLCSYAHSKITIAFFRDARPSTQRSRSLSFATLVLAISLDLRIPLGWVVLNSFILMLNAHTNQHLFSPRGPLPVIPVHGSWIWEFGISDLY